MIYRGDHKMHIFKSSFFSGSRRRRVLKFSLLSFLTGIGRFYENALFILNYTANGVLAIFIVSTFVRHQNRLKFRLELNGMTRRSGSSRRYYLIGTNK